MIRLRRNKVRTISPSRLNRNAAIAGLLVAGPLARNVRSGTA
jgi:hypothetical protein